jgi:hypothetical protein
MKEVKVEQYSKSIRDKYDVTFSELNENELQVLKNALELYATHAKVFYPAQSFHRAILPINKALQESTRSWKE